MSELPLISVALCTYNGARFLKEQLDSILCQSYTHLEVVIVDDCSTDETVSILNEYIRRDPRISLHHNAQNLGYNKNFEKAQLLCRGDFIAICDQDDIWDCDKIQDQFQALNGHELIYHDSEFVDVAGNSMNYRISDKFNFYSGNNPEVFLYLNCVSGHSILFRKSLLSYALPFPTGFHYDQWLAFVATTRGSIDFVKKTLVKYRQHDNNSTDILAVKQQKTKPDKIEFLRKESEWLLCCSKISGNNQSELPKKLHQLSLRRNNSFLSLSYGALIWKNQNSLLYLLKKKRLSKFFYTVRKIWGASAKVLKTT